MTRLALPLLIAAALALPACTAPSDGASSPGAASAATAAAVHLLVAARIAGSDAPDANAMAWDGDGRILAIGRAEDLAVRFPDATLRW